MGRDHQGIDNQVSTCVRMTAVKSFLYQTTHLEVMLLASSSMFALVGYTTDILDDAKLYSNYAGKKIIDVDDTKLAVQLKLDKSYTNPPPRELLLGKTCAYLSSMMGVKPWLSG